MAMHGLCMTLSQGFFGDPNKSTRTSPHSPLQWILVDYGDMIFPSRAHSALLIFSIALLQPILLLSKSYLPGQPVPGSFDAFIKLHLGIEGACFYARITIISNSMSKLERRNILPVYSA